MSENKSSFEKDYVTARNMVIISSVLDIIGKQGRYILAFILFIILVSMIIQSSAVRLVFYMLFDAGCMTVILIINLIGLIFGVRLIN